jgi:hypothetical protein
MTNAPTITATGTHHGTHRAVVPAAITSVAASVALTAFGVRGVAGEPYQWGEFFIVVGIIALGAAVVFGWLVPHGLRAAAPGRIGLTLSLLGLLFVPLYIGLPPVLGTGGILLGLAGHHAGRRSRTSTAAIVVGVLAVLAHVGIYLGDWLNTSGTI